MKKKGLVDMSAAILHHGHIRLLRKAKKYGKVLVALTTDIEVKSLKVICLNRILSHENYFINKICR